MKADVVPDEVIVDRENRLLGVTWSDGHVSQYPFDLLRKHCPCAECRERRSGEAAREPAAGAGLHVLEPQAARFGTVDILSVTPVGRYAMNFRFGDGHAFGIYSFEFLRDMCPCDQCRGARDAGVTRSS